METAFAVLISILLFVSWATWSVYAVKKRYPYNPIGIEKYVPKIIDCDHLFVIDSNIWMDFDYDIFFEKLYSFLNVKSSQIEMFSEQYDEISNLKKKESALAKKRILRFLNGKCLVISNVKSKSNPCAYFDEFLINHVLNNQNILEFTLITKDRDLKIRSISVLKSNRKCIKCNIVDTDDLECDMSYNFGD